MNKPDHVYDVSICFSDNEYMEVNADNIKFWDDRIDILVDDTVMIIPKDKLKYLISRRHK